MNNKLNIVLVDDHVLLRSGLAKMASRLGYNVLYECANGKILIEIIDKIEKGDVIIMDTDMPEMNGFETTSWLKKNYPLMNVLAFSFCDDEKSIIRMFRSGARGYVSKDINPGELRRAIEFIMSGDLYYPEVVVERIAITNHYNEENNDVRNLFSRLNEKEIEFLRYTITEMTYKEIANQMHLSPRTVDGYRDQLFEKLNVKNRVGLVLFAIRSGIVRWN